MEIYCERTDKDTYANFFSNKIAVSMCGASANNIVKVFITEALDGEASHWAYKEGADGSYHYIYGSRRQVEMCSPDFFQSDIANGTGKIVQIKVKEIL